MNLINQVSDLYVKTCEVIARVVAIGVEDKHTDHKTIRLLNEAAVFLLSAIDHMDDEGYLWEHEEQPGILLKLPDGRLLADDVEISGGSGGCPTSPPKH